ncbi:zinc-binding dehydrogenase [Streptosporangium sp. NBC_01756]|uniref:zinc-binding dehydrogenase n=1 Tax=Streptosporangium sp. NBC_01756 TaxID=2975950 RepID=UPI002DD94E9C|nr:zinc-binding dehydrogenase [Streptosporangium sp. NBC_01756]WSC85877.1 zinc-binding dehydrogenase [Streptosporangium sp. NBC_01756]
MRVVRVTRFGDPDVLVAGEAPDPVAGPGQVLVGVEVAEINFVETQLRRGITPGPPLPEPPYIPGGGVAGRVVSVGEGVDPLWEGRRVVTDTTGGNAELAVAAAANLIAVPQGLGLPEAAALLHDGSTAVGLVENAGIRAGEWVLVEAAGGGLGSLLVQLARAAGARVVGAARGPGKLDLARDLGAEVVVDYSETGWTEHVREATGGAGPDVVFDGVGGQIGWEAFQVTARGGRFSVHGASSGQATVITPQDAERRGVTVIGLEQLMGMSTGGRQRIEHALAQAAQGRLRPVIGRTFPLERAAEAHAAMESRSVLGKTLLMI